MAEKTKKNHNEAFKREVVRQFEQRAEGTTAEKVAEGFGIHASQIYDWRLKYGSQIAGSDVETAEMELRRLRRENKQLREERDILKKATAFFARVSS